MWNSGAKRLIMLAKRSTSHIHDSKGLWVRCSSTCTSRSSRRISPASKNGVHLMAAASVLFFVNSCQRLCIHGRGLRFYFGRLRSTHSVYVTIQLLQPQGEQVTCSACQCSGTSGCKMRLIVIIHRNYVRLTSSSWCKGNEEIMLVSVLCGW